MKPLKIVFILFAGLIIISSFDHYASPKRGNINFSRGENLTYRLHYGFINAGVADINIDPKLYKVNGKICYYMNVFGRSVGAFDFGMKIRDYFGAYIDTSSLLPAKSYRKLREGKYRYHEVVFYDQKNKKIDIDIEGKGKKKINLKHSKTLDIVSGYYYLRALPFEKYHKNDTISLHAFLEDEFYEFKIRYIGKEVLKTKFGKINTLVLSPIMPENSLFDGENSIRVWLSDDKNRIPIKASASMFLGAVELDLKSYRGVRYPLNVKK